MPRAAEVPPSLLTAPFTVAMARDAGLPVRSLRGQRFVQLLRGVHAHVDLALDQRAWIDAARLAMPDQAQLSHLTRIQAEGLDFGPARPFHFTVTGDLHLATASRSVFLHRTPRLPPTDAAGVTLTAAFIGACSWERLIDLVQIGDWLLHHEHMTLGGLVELARHEDWRAGATEALEVSRLLDGRSRSLPESETRALLVGAGLPVPEVNVPVLDDDPDSPITDLWYRKHRVAVEYEGSHHFEDRQQRLRDISRYSIMRSRDIAYAQVTKETKKQSRAMVMSVHDLLVSRGYTGPPPVFGDRWNALFAPMRKRPGWDPTKHRSVG